MRIEPNEANQELSENSRTNSASQTTAASNSPASRSNGHDQIQLSNVQARISALVDQVLQLAEVRQERVTTLRDAVQSGSYSPRTDQVARALFTHMAKPAASPGFVNTDSESLDRRRKALGRSHDYGSNHWMAGTLGNDVSSLGD